MALTDGQLEVLRHPARLRILGLFASDPGRSLLPADIAQDLEEEAQINVSQVAYHLTRLQSADLVPKPTARNLRRLRGR